MEIISKEEIEKVVNTITEAEEQCPMEGDKNMDLGKVKDVISSFEGCTPHTVVGALTTALLLLPAGAIMAVLDMGKKAFTAKAMSELMGMFKEKAEDSKEPEE